MTKKEKYGLIKASVVVGLMVIAILTTLIVLPADKDGGWGTITVSAAEANPGAGASGILEVFIIDHDSGVTYTDNISEGAGSTLGYGVDSFNIDIPHSTTFDIIVKCRANTTHAYDSAWNLSLIRCNLTASGALTIGPLEGMTEHQIGYNATYIWVNYELDNSGSGYSIDRDDSVSVSAIKFEYYG